MTFEAKNIFKNFKANLTSFFKRKILLMTEWEIFIFLNVDVEIEILNESLATCPFTVR